MRSLPVHPLLSHHPEPWLQHLTHSVDPGAQGRVDQVGVSLGGTDLGVADHFQRCAAGDQQGGEGVPLIVDSDVGDLRALLHLRPETLGVADRLTGYIPKEAERAAFWHYLAAEADQGDRVVRDRHAVDATLLGVGGLVGPDSQIEVELIKGRRANLPRRPPVRMQRRMMLVAR